MRYSYLCARKNTATRNHPLGNIARRTRTQVRPGECTPRIIYYIVSRQQWQTRSSDGTISHEFVVANTYGRTSRVRVYYLQTLYVRNSIWHTCGAPRPVSRRIGLSACRPRTGCFVNNIITFIRRPPPDRPAVNTINDTRYAYKYASWPLNRYSTTRGHACFKRETDEKAYGNLLFFCFTAFRMRLSQTLRVTNVLAE